MATSGGVVPGAGAGGAARASGKASAPSPRPRGVESSRVVDEEALLEGAGGSSSSTGPDPDANAGRDAEGENERSSDVPAINIQPESPALSRHQTAVKAASRPSTEETKAPDDVSGSEDGDRDAAAKRRKRKEAAKVTVETEKMKTSLQFVQIDPPPGSNDKTTVDIVTVACPGADPHQTWTRDALLENYFRRVDTAHPQGDRDSSSEDGGALSEMGRHLMRTSIVSPGIHAVPPKAVPSWVRQGIRREASTARILLYNHQTPVEGTTLKSLAMNLLQQLHEIRSGEHNKSRPVFFIGHSIGGLVVKIALTNAARHPTYGSILHDCYGVAFFATPHRGSSYLSMRSLSGSIQNLLNLSAPLPRSISDELRVGHPFLHNIDDNFKALSHDLQIWTFYETVDSRLSGGTGVVGGPRDVYFSAPVTSIKSAILNIRQESIFPLQSDHAKCASFGRSNTQTLDLFLKDLAVHIKKAHEHATERDHANMYLEQKVRVEVHGFYEDAVEMAIMERSVRAWSTKLSLKDFLDKGPNQALDDRLNDLSGGPRDNQFLGYRPPATSLFKTERPGTPTKGDPPPLGQNLLGIRLSNAPVASHQGHQQPSSTDEEPRSPDIVLTDPFNKAGRPNTPTTSQGGNSLTQATPGPSSSPQRDRKGSLHPDHATKPPVMRTPSFARSGSEGSVLTFDGYGFPSPRTNARRFSEFPGPNGHTDEYDPKTIGSLAERAARRLSEGALTQELQSTFKKPDPNTRRFVWIHLPFNNPAWVKKVFETLQNQEKREFTELFSRDHWESKHTKGRHSQHHAYFVKPTCNFISPRPMSPRPSSPKSSLHSLLDPSMYHYLFLPYLHFDSYRNLIKRRELITNRMRQGRTRPVPQRVAKLESLELQVVWEFLGHDPPVNCRRTLDQYGYPSLHDTRARDDDQMLYKMTKERFLPANVDPDMYRHYLEGDGGLSRSYTSASMADDESLVDVEIHVEDEDEDEDRIDESDSDDDILNGNVLMVDQLWMWTIDTTTLLTFFPRRESHATEGPLFQQADLRDSIFNEVNADLTQRCENALDLAALTALHAVTVLLDRSSHPDLEIFRIFEEAISILTERLTSSLKEFRAQGFRDKAMDYDAVESKARSIRARHKEEGKRAEKENRDNTSALLELRDIEDELSTLRSLFDEQEKVLEAMKSNYSRTELRELTYNGRALLAEALDRVDSYRRQAQEMINRVRGARDDYDKLLQMVQRQAQVDEVRLSRLQADLASAQSRSVLIFTIFTVIFLPLTFFTGLFGMNTQEWGGENFLSLRTIGVIALPTSAVLIITALIIAWSTRVRRLFRYLSRRYHRWLEYAQLAGRARKRRWKEKSFAKKVLSKREQARAKFRDEEKKVRKEKKRLKKEPSHDFWERHRIEREYEYRIPAMNRKSVSRRRAMAKARLERETETWRSKRGLGPAATM